MKKLRLDLDVLRVHSFATDEAHVQVAASRSIGGGDCGARCKGTVHGAAPGTILKGGLLGTCGRGTVDAHGRTRDYNCTDCCRSNEWACPTDDCTRRASCQNPCNHTTT